MSYKIYAVRAAVDAFIWYRDTKIIPVTIDTELTAGYGLINEIKSLASRKIIVSRVTLDLSKPLEIIVSNNDEKPFKIAIGTELAEFVLLDSENNLANIMRV